MQPDLRDYFAAKAMQAFLSRELPEGHTWNKENIAKDAFLMAEYMIKERNNVTEL